MTVEYVKFSDLIKAYPSNPEMEVDEIVQHLEEAREQLGINVKLHWEEEEEEVMGFVTVAEAVAIEKEVNKRYAVKEYGETDLWGECVTTYSFTS